MLSKNYEINCRNNISILQMLDENRLELNIQDSRTIGEIFQHLCDTKISWLNSISPNLDKIDEIHKISINSLIETEKTLKKQINDLIKVVKEGKAFTGFKSDLTGFIFYLVSHDSHHRGQILTILSHHSEQVPPQVQYGIWNWTYEQ